MRGRDADEEEFLLNELSRINSELVTSQREAHRATAELESVRELEKRYVSMVAHDLNNPLQVILGFTHVLLADPGLTDSQIATLQRIERSARLMMSLVSDLGRGFDEAGEPALELRSFRFDELVESVVARHQILSSDKNITLTFSRDSEQACTVIGDVLKLERVLNNLVGNAVKYSSPGGLVGVSVGVADGTVVTRVVDQGPGISPEGQKQIFEMFHREPGTADLPGVGLGLFISRGIAERHGGTIDVESVPGSGSTFTLTLPARGAVDSPSTSPG